MAQLHHVLVESRQCDDEVQFFRNFLGAGKNKLLLTKLRKTVLALENGSSDLTMSFLSFESANGDKSRRFAQAECEVKRVSLAGEQIVIPIVYFFLDGYIILMNLLDADVRKLPENVMERRALKELLQFLSSDYSVLRDRDNRPEGSLVVKYSQHLMTPLAPKKSYVIDSCAGIELMECCNIEHPLNGSVGDTSFGCEDGWHGRVDVLMMDQVPCSVEKTSKNSKDNPEYSDIAVEADENFKLDHYGQLMAQAVVFSFLQNKESGTVRKSLVPGIGISAEKLVVHLYDCVEDVLLETLPLPLWVSDGEKEELNIGTVLVLWLTLNYKLFCSGVPAAIKCYKANFHKVVSAEQLEKYKKDVKKPVDKKPYLPFWFGAVPNVRLDFAALPLPKKKLFVF